MNRFGKFYAPGRIGPVWIDTSKLDSEKCEGSQPIHMYHIDDTSHEIKEAICRSCGQSMSDDDLQSWIDEQNAKYEPYRMAR